MGNVQFDFSGETVAITGGSSGIGRGIALAFGEAGATVLNGDIRAEPKVGETPTHERIRAGGGTAEFVETDVSDPDQLFALAERATDFGDLDVFVNNAGIFKDVSFLDVDEATLDSHYQVNVKGVYFGCQAAARHLDAGGEIVNVASISSRVAQGGLVHYEATKGAVEMITRGAALELAGMDIRVNAVAPGIVPTELYEGYSDKYHTDEELEELVKPIPMGRPGMPEEVADATLFLASDAAGYTTGETLFVDGGWMVL